MFNHPYFTPEVDGYEVFAPESWQMGDDPMRV
jgi:hypothetical protein